MIEEIIRDFLESKLNVPVVLEHFENEPDSFVIFEKTGSSERNKLGGSMLIIQSYGKSLYEASKLNEELKKAMKKLNTLNDIVSVKLNSDYNYTDTTTKKYRYQAVYDIKHY